MRAVMCPNTQPLPHTASMATILHAGSSVIPSSMIHRHPATSWHKCPAVWQMPVTVTQSAVGLMVTPPWSCDVMGGCSICTSLLFDHDRTAIIEMLLCMLGEHIHERHACISFISMDASRPIALFKSACSGSLPNSPLHYLLSSPILQPFLPFSLVCS